MNTSLTSIRWEFYCPKCDHQFSKRITALRGRHALHCPNCGAGFPSGVTSHDLRILSKAFASRR